MTYFTWWTRFLVTWSGRLRIVRVGQEPLWRNGWNWKKKGMNIDYRVRTKGDPPPPLQIRLRLTMNYNKINLSRDSASKYLLSLKIGSFGSGIKSGEWRLKWSRNSAWCAKRPPHLKHSSSILSPVCSQKWISRKTGLSNFRLQMEQMLSFSCVASNETNWALIAASTGTFGPTFAVTVTPGASTTTLGIWKY